MNSEMGIVIGKAPDATSFLSTSTAVVGILVAVLGAAIVQLLSQGVAPGSQVYRLSPLLRTIILWTLLLVDIWGVTFPLVALYLNTIGPISEQLVQDALLSSLIVVAVNIGLPITLLQYYRSFAIIREWTKITRLSNADSVAAMRANLVDGRYLDASDFDRVMQRLVSEGDASGDDVTRFFLAMFKSVVLGRPGRMGITISRTLIFYLFQSVVRRLLTSGSVHYRLDATDSASVAPGESSAGVSVEAREQD